MSTAKLILDESEYEFPVIVGTEGEKAIDISSLRGRTGHITFDPGYANTGSCKSEITFIDGESGILRYRGYPIEELAASARFPEVCYLLVYDHLPDKDELKEWRRQLTLNSFMHESMHNFFDNFPPTAHPMAILSSMVASLSAFYPGAGDDEKVDETIIRLLAQAKTIAAYSYKKSRGEPMVYPRTSYSYAANFLRMMWATPAEEYDVSPVMERALDLLLIIHADHEQNCSASTVRMVGSSQANLYASVSAGISALWGPLHGGANQQVIEMLEKIRDDEGDFKKYVEMAKDKDSNFRLMGFGHRVYKNFDPRARLLKKVSEKFLRQMEFRLNNPESRGLFVLAMRDRKPFLVNNLSEIESTLSQKSLNFAKRMGSQSLICVPIVYENESLGILAVDNSKSKTPLKQSDLSLLMGVSSQLASSIMNARSFKKLQQSEKKYRELVETANSIILRMDTEGSITFFNKFAQRFLGYTEFEMLGKNAASIILPARRSTRQGFDQLINSLRKDPEIPVVSENETVRRSGEKVWIAWTYKPIFDDEGHFREILCIGNDITELKCADLEKKDLQAQLQRAQKMEAIGTLAGGVAHDLNNILSGIVSYPELLLMDLPGESPLRKPILTIQKSGEKAAAIVQDLLTLARRGVAATEVINLNRIVTEYLLSPEHAKLELNHANVKVEKNLDPNLLNILGSPVHLSKTIMNLVSNAAEAMPDGGTITITTENRHEDRSKNGFDDIDRGDYTILNVSDTGIGISSEDIERIFEPFYTKKAMGRSGTGLGMAVVWGTVKDHRGYIDIQSTEGKGTAVTLYFPVTRREFAKEAESVALENLIGNGESILVVDDIKEQREIAFEMLQKLGYSVTAVSSGEEAINFMRKRSADLMVLDMIMDPGIDGLETYQKVLEINPGQKAIIASGYSESSRVKEAQRLGAGVYVKKPYLLEKFGQAVRAELDR